LLSDYLYRRAIAQGSDLQGKDGYRGARTGKWTGEQEQEQEQKGAGTGTRIGTSMGNSEAKEMKRQ